jgi:hypothetical protein
MPGGRTVTKLALDRAVAAATGETTSTIRRLGFGPAPGGAESDDIALVLDCPFCGRPVAYPGRGRGGEPAMAECPRCDVYFDFADDEVYVSAPAEVRAA